MRDCRSRRGPEGGGFFVKSAGRLCCPCKWCAKGGECLLVEGDNERRERCKRASPRARRRQGIATRRKIKPTSREGQPRVRAGDCLYRRMKLGVWFAGRRRTKRTSGLAHNPSIGMGQRLRGRAGPIQKPLLPLTSLADVVTLSHSVPCWGSGARDPTRLAAQAFHIGLGQELGCDRIVSRCVWVPLAKKFACGPSALGRSA